MNPILQIIPCSGCLIRKISLRIKHIRQQTLLSSVITLGLVSGAYGQCQQALPQKSADASSSAITVTKLPDSSILLHAEKTDFHILPSGLVRASLLKNGDHLALEESKIDPLEVADYVVCSGKKINDFSYESDPSITPNPAGRLGRGIRIEITGHSAKKSAVSLEKKETIEVYDDFPNIALVTTTYKNLGMTDARIDQVVTQRHRLNATQVDPSIASYDLWSFQGSSYEWGQDEILRIPKGFDRPNLMGAPAPVVPGVPSMGCGGGGIPVVDFWTATVGEAIGHLETLPCVVSFPVKVEKDGRINISMQLQPNAILKPGQVYSTPCSFLMIHDGDYYETLSCWSRALRYQGWTPTKQADADYSPNWCGWGYQSDFTAAQMLGTLPKLKELGINWATLDLRWFDNYGDYQPRPDRFSIDSIKELVNEYHKHGVKITLWWQPLVAEDGHGKHSLPKKMTTARLVVEHPDWFILDKNGHRAHMTTPVSTVAVLCPALLEVQNYHKELVTRFIKEWDFDGHKMDAVYTVPPCYNPKHHHASPEESIKAMGAVYKVIQETTRALKAESVTQICPCGTTPNMAWLPYEDQPVTADPVGAIHVRRRIKMYKALLGPMAAVYGDHVELSDLKQVKGDWVETGKDFASTVGTGGVVGTKFTWPPEATLAIAEFQRVVLTPEKEIIWKKWIHLYNDKQLSHGTFRNLYIHGYDSPEAYVIEKGQNMYYAFFSSKADGQWKGDLELRGLRSGKYRIMDYENGRDLGSVDSEHPKLTTDFNGHLLLELIPY